MPRYEAFSLDIEAEFPIPEFGSELDRSGETDVTIRKQDISSLPDGFESPAPTANRFQVAVERGGIAVRNGREILVGNTENGQLQTLRPYLPGLAFAGLLHQRNVLVLHGSVVAMGNKAVAFLGNSGRGKSTLAAAFYLGGWKFVSDDITAVASISPQSRVLPGFRTLKLDSDHPLAPEELESWPNPVGEKRFHHVPRTGPGRSGSLELDRVYVIDEGPTPRIEPVDPQSTALALIRHTSFAPLVDAMGHAERHLNQCTGLADELPVRRLRRPRNVASLDEVRRLVTEDLARGG